MRKKVHTQFVAVTISLTVLSLLAVARGQEDERERPLNDFLDRQGKFCFQIDTKGNYTGAYEDQIVDGNFDGIDNCILFVPPIANFLGSSDPHEGLSMSADYAGLVDKFLSRNLGTTFSGMVTERSSNKCMQGYVEVTVLLKTENALTWVTDGFDFANDPVVFGERWNLDDGKVHQPTFGDTSMTYVFCNKSEAKLPDLIQLLFVPEKGQKVLSIETLGKADNNEGSVMNTQICPERCSPNFHFSVEAIDLNLY